MPAKDYKILLIITGGTMDSVWDGKKDTAVVSEHSALPDYLEKVKLYVQIEFSEICMKDSRSLSHEDREKMLQEIEENPANKILITHGTYTMPDTAKYLKANLKNTDKTIILTGSMTPLKGFDMSDAPFNLGYALSKVQDLESGVYVCMNGRVFTAEEVAKDIAEGKFYSVFAAKA